MGEQILLKLQILGEHSRIFCESVPYERRPPLDFRGDRDELTALEKELIQADRQLHGGGRNGLEGRRHEPDQEEWFTLRWGLDPECGREQSRGAACL